MMTAKNSPCPIVALVGRPNVGKSTFFNRLTRSNRAIIDATPGVTRDRHYQQVVWDEQPFILIDTGGIESETSAATPAEISARSMSTHIREQALLAVSEADVIVFLLDGRAGLTPADYEIAALLRKTDKPVYYVVNKIDGLELERLLPQFYELGAAKLWPLSAEHRYGVQGLLDDLVADLGRLAAARGAALPELPAETIRLACFGRPNVGKSSLINRLMGEERMLVSEIPGTTRDSVDTLLVKDHKNYLLIDTAGIRRKGKVTEKLEKISVMRALAALERCDLALILIDAGEGLTEQDTKVIGYSQEQGRACLLLVNKWDLVKGDTKQQKKILADLEMATPFVGFAPVLTISALTGAGVKRIFPVIEAVYAQYNQTFPTNRLNRLLQEATAAHPPAMYRAKRLKFYYTTQIAAKPPTFLMMVNYPKGVHFSYHRYLVNFFRKGLQLEKVPVKVLFRERQRKDYSSGPDRH